MPGRIEDYALIGDLQSAALIGQDGSVDWLCLPRLDSAACFAALLGDESNGHWRIAPAGAGSATGRRYRDDSLILETTWQTPGGTVRVIDFMPPRGEAADVVRIVEGVSGTVAMHMDLVLRFDYGRIVPWVGRRDRDVGAVAGPDAVWLRTDVPLHVGDRAATADFTVRAGERLPFVLTYQLSHLPRPEPVDAFQALDAVHHYWQRWIGRCDYDGRWPDAVRRPPFADPAQGPHVRADRWHHGRRHHLVAGTARRHPELGLPVLLAARRHLHLAGAARHRICR